MATDTLHQLDKKKKKNYRKRTLEDALTTVLRRNKLLRHYVTPTHQCMHRQYTHFVSVLSVTIKKCIVLYHLCV